MRKHLQAMAVVVMAALVVTPVSAAQEAEKEAEARAAKQRELEKTAAYETAKIDAIRAEAMAPLIPLSVQVVVSRYQGEKRVSSMPYTLAVNANSLRRGGQPARVRMVTQMSVSTAPADSPAQTYMYRDVGTSIDAFANSIDGGRFQLNVSIEDTSVYADGQLIQGAPQPGQRPVFRTFRSINELVLKDGQTAQYTAATDRVTGETTRIDVTLTVFK